MHATRLGPGPVREKEKLLLLVLPLLVGACSPDLREAVGPRIPVPNVTGLIVRAGAPVAGLKVKLEVTASESLLTEVRTGPDGRYGFAGVGPGDWTVRASSASAGDFSRVTWECVLSSPDSIVEAPPLDVSQNGVELSSPGDSAEAPVPGFLNSLVFRWINPWRDSRLSQVRVTDAAGLTVWTSDRLTVEEVRWNGLANRGAGSGRPVDPGVYSWRIRLAGSNGPEFTTAPFTLRLRGSP